MNFKITINEKLSLQLRHEEDAESFFALVEKNRENFDIWFPWVKKTQSGEDMKVFILKCQEEFKSGTSADFGVMYEGRWIGSMGFHTINTKNAWAEIGYWIDKEYEGKGLMTECVKAVIDYGFRDHHLHRIQIKCDARNLKSKAIPERLGFTLEGVIREDHKHDDVFSDGLVYGLLKREWGH